MLKCGFIQPEYYSAHAFIYQFQLLTKHSTANWIWLATGYRNMCCVWCPFQRHLAFITFHHQWAWFLVICLQFPSAVSMISSILLLFTLFASRNWQNQYDTHVVILQDILAWNYDSIKYHFYIRMQSLFGLWKRSFSIKG